MILLDDRGKVLEANCRARQLCKQGDSLAIQNNKLRPKQDNPHRGDAQVWRTALIAEHLQEPYDCWVLRRIGSGIKRQLEIVSDRMLRRELGLIDKMNVIVHLYDNWTAK